MKSEEQLIHQRITKLEELRKLKIEPYPYSYKKTHNTEDILKLNLKTEEKLKDTIKLAGRITSLRVMGKASFGHLQDQTGKIQFYLRDEDIDNYNVFKKLIDIGDIIGITGNVFKTKKGETSIWITKFDLLTKALRPLPEKWHGLKDTELRYRQRYLDLIVNPEVKDTFLKRSQIIKTIREFFDKKGFVEVEIPTLQPVYGGANARPFKTHINAWDLDLYLSISPEIYLKKLVVGGLEKVYTICKNFRNEGVDRTHNPEFTMLESYQAYADYEETMELTESLYEYVAKKVLGTTKINYQGTIIDVKAPWERLTMYEALKKYLKVDIEKMNDMEIKKTLKKFDVEYFHYSKALAIDLLFSVVGPKLIQPVHITDHPKESTPLCKLKRGNNELIERFESFANGWEMTNAYSELNDSILQTRLLEEQEKKGRGGDEEYHPMDKDFIRALEIGMPPTSGLGIGVDRMVMLLTNAKTIRDVIIFPTMRPENK
ncbi:MAG: lysine--tRNA ligase [Nanoarchaeota archaeon]|nr:lysine--tRNA ligase [Nanoarchaeota archaeon]